MISFYSIIFVGLLCQRGQGQFLQYFYSGLNHHFIAPTFTQPQIYYQDQNFYYTQNVNSNIEPEIRTQSKSVLSDNYRGFSYHTAYDNGATANVVFFRGGAINDLQSISNRVTVASDSFDPKSNIESLIHKAFDAQNSKTSLDSTENDVSDLSHFVKALLENKQPSSFITHFYSEGYPANVKPLAIISTSNRSNNETSTLNDEETAESKTQIEVNNLVDDIKINNDNITVTESTVTDFITTTDDVALTSTPSANTTTSTTVSTTISSTTSVSTK